MGRRLRLERPDDGEPLLGLTLLGLLNQRGPMTPGQLAAAERVQPQTLTRALASLEAEGSILRQAHPTDGRRALLSITPAGRHVIWRDVRQRDAWLALTMSEHLTPAERELLQIAGRLLERLAETATETALHSPRSAIVIAHSDQDDTDATRPPERPNQEQQDKRDKPANDIPARRRS